MPRKEFDRLIVWLRRDLRVQDNIALVEACASADEVVPLYIFDDDYLSRPDTGAASVIFLLDALKVLSKNLRAMSGRLIVRRGKASHEIVKACYEFDAQGVYFQQEYEPYGRSRDELSIVQLQSAGKVARLFPGLAAVEPSSVMSHAGDPYTVFTPYKRAWFEYPKRKQEPPPKIVKVPAEIVDGVIPSKEDLNFSTEQRFACGGEDSAQEYLRKFVRNGLSTYAEKRNLLAVDGTSMLSRHLHFGTISPLQVIDGTNGICGSESFLSEIAWRDFYLQILFHFPHVEHGAFKRQFDNICWDNDADLFERWCIGLTGYPVVDAAMRQLNQEAWMHNRARMIVASFLTKDLLIDWKKGAQYFMEKLVDGDLAANNGGWQWSAGTGTDAQPYFRVFNPTTQGEKFDPSGDYVRRYLPELRNVPNTMIHCPWKMTELEQELYGCVLGTDYPEPIVDHTVRRMHAIEIYRSVGDKY